MDLQPFFNAIDDEDFEDHCVWNNLDYTTIFPNQDPGKLLHDCFHGLQELALDGTDIFMEALHNREEVPRKYLIAPSRWVILFLTLPTCIWYESQNEEPPKKKRRQQDLTEMSTEWTCESRLVSNTDGSPNYLNEYNYVTLAPDSQAMPDSFLNARLKDLNEQVTLKKARRFTGQVQVMYGEVTNLHEDTIDDFLCMSLYRPLRSLVSLVNHAEDGVFNTILPVTYNFPYDKYFTRTDRAFCFNGDTLVVIEVKAPSISDCLDPSNRNSVQFTQMVTQVFYQTTSAGTPYAIFSDGFISMLLIIGDNPHPKVETTSGVEECDLTVEDVHVPIQMQYYVVDHKQAGLTAAACHAVFFNLAYDVLIKQGLLEAKQKEMWSLNKKCKMSPRQKQRRFTVQYNHFHRKCENGVGKCNQFLHQRNRNDNTLTMPLDKLEPISVSLEGSYRNAQVYAMPHNHILKVYDPYKTPHDSMTRSKAEKIALYSMKRELLAYNLLKDSKQIPKLVEYGFAKLETTSIVDYVVGPYLIMEDVGGSRPDLEDERVVDRVLTAYQELVKRGVLHGDLKEGNMRLVEDKVIFFDFGVSEADKLIALLESPKKSEQYKRLNQKLLSRLEKDIDMVVRNIASDTERERLRKKHRRLLKRAYKKKTPSLKSLQGSPKATFRR